MENKTNNKIEEVVSAALKNIREIISSDTITGNPVKTDNGDFLFPISKITFGVLAGGGEYGKTGIFSNGKNYPFSAGNGAIVHINPCAFLIQTKNGGYKFVSNENSLDFMVEKAVDYFNKLKEEKWKK